MIELNVHSSHALCAYQAEDVVFAFSQHSDAMPSLTQKLSS